MHKLWAVIRREFQTRVQSKAFVISTILGPVFMAFMMVMPILMNSRETTAKRIVVIDGDCRTADGMLVLDRENRGSRARHPVAKPRRRDGKLSEAMLDGGPAATGVSDTLDGWFQGSTPTRSTPSSWPDRLRPLTLLAQFSRGQASPCFLGLT